MIEKNFIAPMKGKLISIEKVPDDTFSLKMMGEGFAFIIEGDSVYAPLDGEIVSIFPGGHAILMNTKEDIQILIHIGLETHKLQGMHDPQVKNGDVVKQGDLLVKTKLGKEKDINSKYSPIVFLNKEKIKLLKEDVEVEAKENNFVEIEY